MAKYRLTKSNLLYYRQCPKRLFLSVHHPELAEFDPNKQLIFDQGHLVGEVARGLYPGGEMVEFTGDPDPSVEQTRRLLTQSDKPIYEATFLHDEVLIRSDLIFPYDGGVRAVEVKQSTSVKDTYHDDCAIQAWVIRQSGHRVQSFAIAHINNDFVYQGDGNYQGLFIEVPVDEHIQALQAEVPVWVADAKKVIEARREPDIKMGKQCKNPYDCPFIEYCSLEEPEYSVKKLPNPGKLVAQLEAKGYSDLRDVPADMLPKPVHGRMRRTVISGKAELDPAAGGIVKKLAYPRYYFDFESINFAVPIWKGAWPYQQVTFQWSCHVQHQDGKLTHSEFLDTSGEFPARACAEQLLAALGGSGPIVVYYATFEKTRLKELAVLYPDLAPRINAAIDRLFDIWPVMKEHYYHPSMNGSWSLKKVLPIFPLTIGTASILSEGQDDIGNPSSPVCYCSNPPRVAVSIGFWEPVRLVDVTRTPFCMVGLGGIAIDPGVDVPRGAQVGHDSQTRNSFYHAHWYANPILYWLEVLLDFPCLEQGSLDLVYLTEVDPLWADDELTAILNPEAVLFANPLAKAACAADCVAATAGFPIASLFWCAGCQGSIYPMDGHVATHIGGVQASTLITQRMAAKMHRQFATFDGAGPAGLCGYYMQPIMDKTHYKMQMVYPVPNTQKDAGQCCQPFGRSTMIWGAGKEFPVSGEDFAYQIFRKRNCCAGAY